MNKFTDISTWPQLGPYFVAPPAIADAHTPPEGDYRAGQFGFVWSIGRAERDVSFEWQGQTHLVPKGTVLFSRADDLYQRDGFTCLWLR